MIKNIVIAVLTVMLAALGTLALVTAQSGTKRPANHYVIEGHVQIDGAGATRGTEVTVRDCDTSRSVQTGSQRGFSQDKYEVEFPHSACEEGLTFLVNGRIAKSGIRIDPDVAVIHRHDLSITTTTPTPQPTPIARADDPPWRMETWRGPLLPVGDAIFSAFDTTAVYQIKPDGSYRIWFPNSEGIGVNTLAHVERGQAYMLQGYLGFRLDYISCSDLHRAYETLGLSTDEFMRLRDNTLHHAGCFDDRSTDMRFNCDQIVSFVDDAFLIVHRPVPIAVRALLGCQSVWQ